MNSLFYTITQLGNYVVNEYLIASQTPIDPKTKCHIIGSRGQFQLQTVVVPNSVVQDEIFTHHKGHTFPPHTITVKHEFHSKALLNARA